MASAAREARLAYCQTRIGRVRCHREHLETVQMHGSEMHCERIFEQIQTTEQQGMQPVAEQLVHQSIKCQCTEHGKQARHKTHAGVVKVLWHGVTIDLFGRSQNMFVDGFIGTGQ